MGKAEGLFLMDGVSTNFSAAADGSLDKRVLPSTIKVRIDVMKEMAGAR